MKKEKTTSEPRLRAWNFPHLGKTIRAVTREEALEQVKTNKKSLKKTEK